MTNKLRTILHNNRGVSLTMALLVFLVCAMVGSVVLAAGSAAAGRLTSVRKSEQDYYSLMSAAEYIRSSIDGKSVGIVSVNTVQQKSVSLVAKNANGVGEVIEQGDWVEESAAAGSVSENGLFFTHRANDKETDESDDELSAGSTSVESGNGRKLVTKENAENILDEMLAAHADSNYYSKYFAAGSDEITCTLKLDDTELADDSEVQMTITRKADLSLSVLLEKNGRFLRLDFTSSPHEEDVPENEIIIYDRYEPIEGMDDRMNHVIRRKLVKEYVWEYSWQAEDIKRSR